MKRTLFAIALASCGHHSPQGSSDASVDAATPELHAVTLHAAQPPVLIAYRDGAGPWSTPAPVGASGDYTLYVADDYRVVIACLGSFGFDAQLLSATFADGDHQAMSCYASTSSPPPNVEVTGQMAQPGQINLGSGGAGSALPGPFDFDFHVEPGTYDLVAVAASHRMLIHRDLAIASSTTVPTVDVDADGAPMSPVTLTIDNLGADRPIVVDNLATDDMITGLVPCPVSPGCPYSGTITLYVPPATVLRPGDSQQLQISTLAPPLGRGATTDFTGTQTHFTLMPALPSTAYVTAGNTLTTSLSALPSYTSVSLVVLGSAGRMGVAATRRWIDATAATEIGFDAMPPGYDPAWHIDLGGPYRRELVVNDDSTPIHYFTERFEGVNGAM